MKKRLLRNYIYVLNGIFLIVQSRGSHDIFKHRMDLRYNESTRTTAIKRRLCMYQFLILDLVTYNKCTGVIFKSIKKSNLCCKSYDCKKRIYISISKVKNDFLLFLITVIVQLNFTFLILCKCFLLLYLLYVKNENESNKFK